MQITPVRATACAAALALSTGLVSGCGIIGSGSGGGETAEFTVSSQAFSDLKDIPPRYACSAYRGQGKTPPLHWSGVPDAKAFVIVMDDPDARGGTYIHWVLSNLEGTTLDMVEGQQTPPKAIVGENSDEKRAYEAPCPPQGQRHRYRYTVYALKEPIPAGDAVKLKKSLPAIASRSIARGRITGYLGQSKGS
ncbi:YbhB/YbcL family Raf kinase inhibitor-like protein [Actinocorallia longicatena]|uniref:YbhB/YbcL family Raf kinase inhibitor-like protein n=1 Tax=Actinocorallia longicatena TaxID=111803 RepID=A0ABP6QCP8_9ACTN